MACGTPSGKKNLFHAAHPFIHPLPTGRMISEASVSFTLAGEYEFHDFALYGPAAGVIFRHYTVKIDIGLRRFPR
jgi:hypothetical protein